MSPTSDERGSISAEHVLVCALVALVGVPAWLALEGAVSTETACVADRVATGDSEPCAGSSSEDEEDVGSPVWNVADTSGADALALSASSPAREPASATAAEPEATTVPWPTPAIAPEPTAAAEPAPAPEPAPGPAPEPAPAPQPTPTIAPEPTPAPAPEPTPSIAPEPEAAPAAELAPALQPPPAPACAPFDLLCEAGHVVSNVVDGAAGAARDTGSFVWGFGSGVVDGGAALVSGTIDLGATVVNGTVDAVTHPVETVNAIATTTVNAVDAVLHPVETGQSILDGAGQLASSVVDAVGDMGNTLVNGTWEERGRLLGRGTFEVASFAVPVTKLGALGGLALRAGRALHVAGVEPLAARAATAGDVLAVPTAAGRVTRAAEEASVELAGYAPRAATRPLSALTSAESEWLYHLPPDVSAAEEVRYVLRAQHTSPLLDEGTLRVVLSRGTPWERQQLGLIYSTVHEGHRSLAEGQAFAADWIAGRFPSTAGRSGPQLDLASVDAWRRAPRSAYAADLTRWAQEIAPEMRPVVGDLLEAGPNRWIEVPRPAGARPVGRSYVRGVSGDYTRTTEEGLRETFDLLAGRSLGDKYAYGFDDASELAYFTGNARAYGRPLTIWGRSPDLVPKHGSEVLIPAGRTLDSVEAIGLFAAPEPSLEWAVQYLRFQRLAHEAGIPVSASSRGGRFALELEAAVDRAAHLPADEVRPMLQELLDRYR